MSRRSGLGGSVGLRSGMVATAVAGVLFCGAAAHGSSEDTGPALQDDAGTPDAEAAERSAFLEEADRLIRDRNLSGLTSEDYRIQTDDPRLSVAGVLRLLESFQHYFESYWSGQLALAAPRRRTNVYLFYSYFKYNQILTGESRFDDFRTAGHYRNRYDVIVVHTDAASGGLADTLVHEAAHQLLTERLFSSADEVTPWVSEGLASYFGFTFQDAEDRFEPGTIGGKSIALFPRAKRAQGGVGWQQVQTFRKARKKDPGWPLREMIAIEEPAEFLSGPAEERYVASWLLVHYLLHGSDGEHRAAFLRYLAREAAGDGGEAALYEELGIDGRELETAWAAYVRDLKPKLRKR